MDWNSDKMVANFFMLACPYLFDFETGTYFTLIRGTHSQYTISKIHDTAQIILDIYNKKGQFYIQPLKVWKRYSPSMFMLHEWKNNQFIPVTRSGKISEILSEYTQPWVNFKPQRGDIWTDTFTRAYNALSERKEGNIRREKLSILKEKLIRMLITHDTKLYPLICKYFELQDLLSIGERMIGTGLIGGKSVGLACQIPNLHSFFDIEVPIVAL